MKVILVSAPYRGENDNELYHHVTFARIVACELWKAGAMAICPHLNSYMMSGIVPEEAFLDGYCELVKRCDAILLLGSSEGCLREEKTALDHGVRVLRSVEEARNYAQGG